LSVLQGHFSCSATSKEWRISQGMKSMFDRLSREEIIQKRKEIEHFLKTDPDIPTRRYLDRKDAELYAALERLEAEELAA